jgi:hypothetical protein
MATSRATVISSRHRLESITWKTKGVGRKQGWVGIGQQRQDVTVNPTVAERTHNVTNIWDSKILKGYCLWIWFTI